jgi:hypothetical protein
MLLAESDEESGTDESEDDYFSPDSPGQQIILYKFT